MFFISGTYVYTSFHNLRGRTQAALSNPECNNRCLRIFSDFSKNTTYNAYHNSCLSTSKNHKMTSARHDASLQLPFQKIPLRLHIWVLARPPLKPTKWQHQTRCFPSDSVSNKLTDTRCLFSHLPSSEGYKKKTMWIMPIFSQTYNFDFMNNTSTKRPFTRLSASGG